MILGLYHFVNFIKTHNCLTLYKHFEKNELDIEFNKCLRKEKQI